ncbi:hypothetical protein SZ66_22375 [Pantoea ananatis]|nr:hypothetical protein [Pantoea ananatis]
MLFSFTFYLANPAKYPLCLKLQLGMAFFAPTVRCNCITLIIQKKHQKKFNKTPFLWKKNYE